MFKDIRNFCVDDVFRLTAFNDKIDVINYTEIDHFDDSKIFIRYDGGTVNIKGENLIIAKLLNDEILINGKIKMVEFKW